ncbi:golgin-45 isoform X2 [Athalia rosae]|uniref:golgin-45 isoform X2 n=1 Tax=Athalia rosae TaxID=37344 RepID=UPI0020335B1D|nr:golgin-45 isoform X2 [Athalia rosae]XP_048504991.1 golgin-45 isoform X2 [Athalia rosae]
MDYSPARVETAENVATFSTSRKNSVKNTTFPETRPMTCSTRTQGDGMEFVTDDKIEKKQIKVRLGDTLIYHPMNLKQTNSTPPVTPVGMIVNLTPKSVSQSKKEKQILSSLKSKEPKFVPYEPYKAAVNPIIPYEKKTKRASKNNLDINVMVSQMAMLKASETEKKNQVYVNNKDYSQEIVTDPAEIVRKSYETEIQKLKEENAQLESQLKFQAQVNGELKNLLVAAVGEDLETKVHLLTEDKLQLARALLSSAQNLNTHQEQTEWLAGQCEVWRSKFLASSLMVEELARWKAALCQRTTDLQETIKRLLEERSKVRETSLRTYRTLSILRENFDPVGTVSNRRHELPSTNIIDLAEGSCQLTEILKVQLLAGMDKINLRKEMNIVGLEMKTIAERNAEQLLMNPNLLLSGRQDAACSAVMGAAVAVGGQLFLPSRSSCPNISCCPHCSGEIKQI